MASKIDGSCGKDNKNISSKNHTTSPCLLYDKVDIVSPSECCIAYCPPSFNLPLSQDACTYLVFNDRPRSMKVAAKLIKALAEMYYFLSFSHPLVQIVLQHESRIGYCPPPFDSNLSQDACTYLAKMAPVLAKNIIFSIFVTW